MVAKIQTGTDKLAELKRRAQSPLVNACVSAAAAISASFVAMHRPEPRSSAWASAAAITRRCALICLCAHSGALPAAEWSLSGIVGAGDRVNVAGIEAQLPSGFGGALADRWSWSLRWAGDVAHWWARNQGDTSATLWEIGLTPAVELRRVPASGMAYYVEGGIGIHLLSERPGKLSERPARLARPKPTSQHRDEVHAHPRIENEAP